MRHLFLGFVFFGSFISYSFAETSPILNCEAYTHNGYKGAEQLDVISGRGAIELKTGRNSILVNSDRSSFPDAVISFSSTYFKNASGSPSSFDGNLTVWASFYRDSSNHNSSKTADTSILLSGNIQAGVFRAVTQFRARKDATAGLGETSLTCKLIK